MRVCTVLDFTSVLESGRLPPDDPVFLIFDSLWPARESSYNNRRQRVVLLFSTKLTFNIWKIKPTFVVSETSSQNAPDLLN